MASIITVNGITFKRLEHSIPLNSMPLNKNFISIESRLESFKNYNGQLDAKYLAAAGYFYDEKINFLNCYNCGHSSQLNNDGTIRTKPNRVGSLYHFNLCTLMPSQNEADKAQVCEELNTNKEVEKCMNDTPSTEEQGKDTNDDNNGIKVQDSELEKDENKALDSGNADAKRLSKKRRFLDPIDKDMPIDEDSGAEGWLWDCASCGLDLHYKVINLPCRHRTYCIFCSKTIEKCSLCEEDVTYFMVCLT